MDAISCDCYINDKSFKGGARMRPEGVLARIICEDGTEYIVRCCVNASLLEVNAQLKSKPNLIIEMPATQGYLALFQPLPNEKNPAENLLSLESYRELRFPEPTRQVEASNNASGMDVSSTS